MDDFFLKRMETQEFYRNLCRSDQKNKVREMAEYAF